MKSANRSLILLLLLGGFAGGLNQSSLLQAAPSSPASSSLISVSTSILPGSGPCGQYGNPDGSFYPGDMMSLVYSVGLGSTTVTVRNVTSTYPVQFDHVQVLYNATAFLESTASSGQSGSVSFQASFNTSPGSYQIKLVAFGTATVQSGNSTKTETVSASSTQTVILVGYFPEFSQIFAYPYYKGDGETAYQKPFVLFSRYDGNDVVRAQPAYTAALQSDNATILLSGTATLSGTYRGNVNLKGYAIANATLSDGTFAGIKFGLSFKASKLNYPSQSSTTFTASGTFPDELLPPPKGSLSYLYSTSIWIDLSSDSGQSLNHNMKQNAYIDSFSYLVYGINIAQSLGSNVTYGQATVGVSPSSITYSLIVSSSARLSPSTQYSVVLTINGTVRTVGGLTVNPDGSGSATGSTQLPTGARSLSIGISLLSRAGTTLVGVPSSQILKVTGTIGSLGTYSLFQPVLSLYPKITLIENSSAPKYPNAIMAEQGCIVASASNRYPKPLFQMNSKNFADFGSGYQTVEINSTLYTSFSGSTVMGEPGSRKTLLFQQSYLPSIYDPFATNLTITAYTGSGSTIDTATSISLQATPSDLTRTENSALIDIARIETTDATAIAKYSQDFYSNSAQLFTGFGSLKAEVLRTSFLNYNVTLTLTRGSQSLKYVRNNATLLAQTLNLNFLGGGVTLNASSYAGETTLNIDATKYSGGIDWLAVYQPGNPVPIVGYYWNGTRPAELVGVVVSLPFFSLSNFPEGFVGAVPLLFPSSNQTLIVKYQNAWGAVSTVTILVPVTTKPQGTLADLSYFGGMVGAVTFILFMYVAIKGAVGYFRRER